MNNWYVGMKVVNVEGGSKIGLVKNGIYTIRWIGLANYQSSSGLYIIKDALAIKVIGIKYNVTGRDSGVHDPLDYPLAAKKFRPLVSDKFLDEIKNKIKIPELV